MVATCRRANRSLLTCLRRSSRLPLHACKVNLFTLGLILKAVAACWCANRSLRSRQSSSSPWQLPLVLSNVSLIASGTILSLLAPDPGESQRSISPTKVLLVAATHEQGQTRHYRPDPPGDGSQPASESQPAVSLATELRAAAHGARDQLFWHGHVPQCSGSLPPSESHPAISPVIELPVAAPSRQGRLRHDGHEPPSGGCQPPCETQPAMSPAGAPAPERMLWADDADDAASAGDRGAARAAHAPHLEGIVAKEERP